MGCTHWEPGSGQRRNKAAQNWEGAGLFPNLGMQWGHMPVTKTMEGKRSPTRWTRRSGCLGKEIAVGMSRTPLSLNQEGDRV